MGAHRQLMRVRYFVSEIREQICLLTDHFLLRTVVKGIINEQGSFSFIGSLYSVTTLGIKKAYLCMST